ncbi:MAG: hypothetical protein M1827_003252 [Pycnora praestabilis]|nr:MAG: hypothetical protein M1827_003252 [Pycnora praestabilis]
MPAAIYPGTLPKPPLPSMQLDLFDYRQVNTSPEALEFNAAASYQRLSARRQGCDYGENQTTENLLVVSPYTKRSHLLDFDTIDKPNQILARALTVMKPVRKDYATAPYVQTFNWDAVVHMTKDIADSESYEWKAQSFYVVVFRSQVPPATDRFHLGELDEKAHEEAMESGGLLKYWFGVPDSNGRNLATCVWRKVEDAKRGGAGEGHQRAMRATRGLYSEWELQRFRFTVEDRAQKWSITEWHS